MSYVLRAWAASDAGLKREHNEDRFLAEPADGLFLVCDGMGGPGVGDVGAQYVVDRTRRLLAESPALDEWPGDETATTPQRRAVLEALRRSLQQVNEEVFTRAREDRRLRGMGSTASLLAVLGNRVFMAHVGDSRIYLLRGPDLHRVTEDHTILAEILKRQHGFDSQTLQRLPYKHSLTRSIGSQPAVAVDTLDLELLPGDRFLLCTDGLHRYFDSQPDLLLRLWEAGPLEAAPQRMLDYARAGGGDDNATVIVVEARPSEISRETTLTMRQQFANGMQSMGAVRLFEHLEQQELLRLLAIAEDCSFAEQEVILREGDPGDTMFLILEGQVEVLVGERRVAELREGAHFGEMALVTQQPRTASIRALAPLKTKRLRRDPLYEVLREDQGLANKVLWNIVQVLSQRLGERSRQMAGS